MKANTKLYDEHKTLLLYCKKVIGNLCFCYRSTYHVMYNW